MAAKSTRAVEAQLIQDFAKELASQSWCVDMSAGARPVARHADSNRTACSATFTFQFWDWKNSKGIDFTPEDEEAFAKSLEARIIQCLPRVYGASFRPTDEKFFDSRGAMVMNTYHPYRPKIVQCSEGFRLLDECLERLVPDPAQRKIILQFMAHTVFQPRVRPQWGVLLAGAGGTGKSVLVELLEMALGQRHVWRDNTFEAAFKTFSEVLPNNLLVTFDDAPTGKATLEQLKHAITRGTQEVEVKGVQTRILREVYARIVVLTNERELFDLSEDRRFFVPDYCTHRIDKLETDAFFRRLVAWKKLPEAPAIIYSWLARVDLSDFDASTPVFTEAHRRMGSGRGSQLAELVSAYVEDQRLVHVEEIRVHALRLGHEKPSTAAIDDALKKAGYERRRRNHPDGERQLEIWVPEGKRRARALNYVEIGRLRGIGVLSNAVAAT